MDSNTMTNDTKFSPGEWLMTPPEDNVNNPVICGQRVGTYEIYSKQDTAWIAQVLAAENSHGEANARLVLAAPKMHAALNSAVLGYSALLGLLRTMLSKSDLNLAAVIAQEHIEYTKKILAEVDGE